LLQHSAERQKGNPSPETFLRQPLFFGDSRQRLSRRSTDCFIGLPLASIQ
jgi:hypothetical protein